MKGCPHIGGCPYKSRQECKCPFSLNTLQDGKIVRTIDGVVKRVYRLSEVLDGKIDANDLSTI